MNIQQAKELVQTTFQNPFDKGRFQTFLRNLLNKFDETKILACNSPYIKEAFRQHVARYERLGTYITPDGEKIDLLIVHLNTKSKLERARTALRNFVADHLKNRDNKDAALVAFVSPNENQWRFSYVKMEYTAIKTESGKVGIEKHLTPARRFSYIVGEGESCHTAQARFVTLLQDTTNQPKLTQLENAFSVESVTKEFFEQYKTLFLNLKDALDTLAEKNKTIRKEFADRKINTDDFAKKLMGQIVFLYFLQKKGWLGVAKGKAWGDGTQHFLRNLFAKTFGDYKNFFNDILEHLFYDTLATDRGHDAWCSIFKCRIPFLNGGLFEPLGEYDWKNTDIRLPNELFSNTTKIDKTGDVGTGILDVFDRYNFTVNEAEPLEKEVAIDPEMLGKVFEELLEIKERKSKGSFYTPREIVHYMCQESLINYLDAVVNGAGTTVSVPREDIETFIHSGDQIAHYESVKATYAGREMPVSIKKYAKLIDEKLAEITVCDPAIGSGAFPVGMMTEIVRARLALTPYFNDSHERTPYFFKRHAIQNCLYGVDIDLGAVEIAKLRLWLSLVVDEEDVKQIKPLPNLDYKIVAGNSLLGVESFFNWKAIQEIEKLKTQYFDQSTTSEKIALRHRIDELIFEVTDGQREFDFKIYFSEVFDQDKDKTGGFDVVIANPPYISAPAQENDAYLKTQRDFLKKNNNNKGKNKNKCKYQTLYQKWDLYIPFVELGLMLLRERGIFAMIVPYPLTNQTYAKLLRELILKTYDIYEITDLGDVKVFDSATVSNCIPFIKKAPPQNKVSISHLNESINSISRSFDKSHQELVQDEKTAIWNLTQEKRESNRHATMNVLGDFCYISVGMVLNADEKTVKGDFVKEDLISDTEDKIHSRKYIEAKDIEKYRVKRVRFLEWNTDRCPSQLRRQTFPELYDPQKILMNCLGTITTTLDEGERYLHNHSIYCAVLWRDLQSVENKSITASVKRYSRLSRAEMEKLSRDMSLQYLIGILNSKYAKVLLRNQRSGDYHIYPEHLRNIPIPTASPEQQQPIITLVDRILSAKKASPTADTSVLEREIDELVYQLYGLTEEEVKIVEG